MNVLLSLKASFAVIPIFLFSCYRLHLIIRKQVYYKREINCAMAIAYVYISHTYLWCIVAVSTKSKTPLVCTLLITPLIVLMTAIRATK